MFWTSILSMSLKENMKLMKSQDNYNLKVTFLFLVISTSGQRTSSSSSFWSLSYLKMTQILKKEDFVQRKSVLYECLSEDSFYIILNLYNIIVIQAKYIFILIYLILMSNVWCVLIIFLSINSAPHDLKTSQVRTKKKQLWIYNSLLKFHNNMW